MDSFLFAVNAVAPIILTVAIGYLLKKAGFMNADFAKAANKLVFRLFLPAMLFLNVYRIASIGGINMNYIMYCLVALLVIFLLSIPAVILVARKREYRGVLLQGAFRSNYALIGIPLAQSLFGNDGVIVATLLSAAVIPLFNILAVISLSIFRVERGKKPSITHILSDIVRNPLIQSIALGVLVLGVRAFFTANDISFRLTDITPLFTVLGYLSDLATPLALLVLGAQFEFSAVKALRREIIFGTLMRTVIVPLLGIGTAYAFFSSQFSGAHFAAFAAMFATPVAVSSVPMAQEMDGDVALAGQLVVWTTLASAFSVFLVAFLLRLAGIF
ncbi:MAG: AEC family transporter [Clostridia bacterium]|nr:AEC family transporter [Clostridia bacterium]